MIAQPVIGPPSRNAVAKEPPNPAALLQRFHTQEFEPSPLDELSKLELTAEEVEMDSDPYSMRIVRWSEVTRIVVNGEPYWRISIRYRAKNRMSAYVLSEQVFYIRHNKIMSTFEID